MTIAARECEEYTDTNVAVVGTGSPDETGYNNARVRVAGAQRPRACVSNAPWARASC